MARRPCFKQGPATHKKVTCGGCGRAFLVVKELTGKTRCPGGCALAVKVSPGESN